MRAADAYCLAALAALWCAFWWPVIGGDEWLYARDLAFFALPAKTHLAERLLAGELPLWTPWVSGGMPFLADVSNQVLYPGNLVFGLPLEPQAALSWFAIAHHLGAMAALYALGRTLGPAPPAALFAALAYGLGGYVLLVTENVNYLPATVWVPAFLACVAAGAGRGGARAVALGGACIAALLLAGDALDAGVAIGAALLWTLLRPLDPGTAGRAGGVRVVAGAALLGALIAAAQVLPTLELIAHSVRAGGLAAAELTQFSLPPARLVELVLPHFFGAEYPAGEFLAPELYPARGTPWAVSIHLGLLTVAAALAAAWLRPRAALPWAALAALSLVLALGGHLPGYGEVVRHLPLLGDQRYPEKHVFGLSLAVAVLAGLGADALLARAAAPRPALRPALRAIAALGILAALAIAVEWPARAWLAERATGTSVLWSALLGREMGHLQGQFAHTAVLGAAIGAVVLACGRASRAAIVALMAIAVADLAWVHSASVLSAPAALLREDAPPEAARRIAGERIWFDPLAPDTAVVERDDATAHRLRAALGEGRHGDARGYWFLRGALLNRARLVPNHGVAHGVEYLNGGYSPLQPAPNGFMERVMAPDLPREFAALSAAGRILTPIAPAREAWRGLAEAWRDPDANLRVLEVPGALPRALLVPGALRFDGPVAEARHLLAGAVDFRRTVILGGAATAAPAPAPNLAGARVEWRRPLPERIELEVDSPYERAWLVVNESWFPGWAASVDARPVPVERANFRFMAVPVGAGRHAVTLTYAPTWPWPGLGLSALGLAAFAALARRRPSRSGG